MPSNTDTELLRAALTGLEKQRDDIILRISEVRAMLGGKAKTAAAGKVKPGTEKVVRTRRPMSAAAKKRIAAAQRKRWAEYHKTQKS